jgi:exodeoxyribonuclease VII large subunit
LRPDLVGQRIARLRERLEARDTRLVRAGDRRSREARAALDALGRTLETLGPHRVLERGFAIVRDGAGAVLTSADPASRAPALEIEFADGRVRTRPERRPAGRGSRPGPAQGQLL